MSELLRWRKELELKAAEFEHKKAESRLATWSSPIVLAILGATLASLGNVAATFWSARLESKRAENQRFLEVIKTGNVEQAHRNLKFLVDVRLISDDRVIERVRSYVTTTSPNMGPVLTAYSYTAPTVS